jgi:hypothetical protein
MEHKKPRIRYSENGPVGHLQATSDNLAKINPLELEELASKTSTSPVRGHDIDTLLVRDVFIYDSPKTKQREPDFRVVYRISEKDVPVCHVDLSYSEAQVASELVRRELHSPYAGTS